MERPLQVVYRSIETPLEVRDLRGLSQEEQERYLESWTEERKRHVFDWERGPLFQINIFLRADDSIQFVLSFHHAVLDGWSRAVLTTQLYNRYERLLAGAGRWKRRRRIGLTASSSRRNSGRWKTPPPGNTSPGCSKTPLPNNCRD